MTIPPVNLQAQITIQNLTDDQMAKFYDQRGQNKIGFTALQPQQGHPQLQGNAIVVSAASADGLVAAAQIIKTIVEG